MLLLPAMPAASQSHPHHSPHAIWLLALVFMLPTGHGLALFPSHQMAVFNPTDDEPIAAAVTGDGWGPMSRNARSFAQSFPYSTLSYYRSLKPMLLSRYRNIQQKYDQQKELERQLEDGRQLAQMLETFNGGGDQASRKRRSDGGVILKSERTWEMG